MYVYVHVRVRALAGCVELHRREILVGAKEIWNKARFVARMMEEWRENAVDWLPRSFAKPVCEATARTNREDTRATWLEKLAILWGIACRTPRSSRRRFAFVQSFASSVYYRSYIHVCIIHMRTVCSRNNRTLYFTMVRRSWKIRVTYGVSQPRSHPYVQYVSREKNSERYEGSLLYDHNLNPGLSDMGFV